ncbi:MAG: hypothetical protein K6B39_10145 [Lachnospiraceae bacterium]|nr:hypothetical protein [Lachnospiraceae bacterium]
MKNRLRLMMALCGMLVIAVMILLAGCGSSKKKSVSPTGNETRDLTPTAAAPTAVSSPAATATATPMPTEAPTPTAVPTEAKKPEATPTVEPTVALSCRIEEKAYAEESDYFPYYSSLYDSTVPRKLDRVKLSYVTKDGETAVFDSGKAAESYQSSFADRAEEVYEELKSRFDGNLATHTKLLESVVCNTGDYPSRLDIYERAVYGYADVVYESDRSSAKLSPVFNFRIEYCLGYPPREDEPHESSYVEQYTGVLCDETRSEDKSGKISVTYLQFYDHGYQCAWIPSAVGTCILRETEVKEEDTPMCRKGIRRDFEMAVSAVDGSPIVYLEQSIMNSGVLEIPLEGLLYTADGTVIFSAKEDDWKILDNTVSEYQCCYDLLQQGVLDGAKYPVKHYLLLTDEEGRQYHNVVPVQKGVTMDVFVERVGMAGSPTLRCLLYIQDDDFSECVEVGEVQLLETRTLSGDTKSLLLDVREEEVSWDSVPHSGLSFLKIAEQAANSSQKTVKFDSDRYRAEHISQFRKSAEAYEKALRAEYKGKILFREKKLETISFGQSGKLEIYETAAIGDTSQLGKNETLYCYRVSFRFSGQNDKDQIDGILYESNNFDGNSSPYIHSVRMSTTLFGEPIATVRIRRTKPSDGPWSYSQDNYDTVAYFDENGKAVMYALDCWGEATDYYRTPGEQKLSGLDGKVYSSYKDDKIFGYKLSHIGEVLSHLADSEYSGTVNYHGIPQSAITVAVDDGYKTASMNAEQVVNKDLKIVFEAYSSGWWTYYQISFVYKGEKIEFVENRIYP